MMENLTKLRFSVGVAIVASVVLVGSPPAKGDTVTRAIIAEENDVEEFQNSGRPNPPGTMDMASSDLELFSEGGGGLNWQVIGVQYDSLGIPQGSTINSATITFQVDNAGVAGDPNATIYAEAVDNSAVFADVSANVTSRPRTTASVAWAPALNNTVGSTVVTPNIAPIIQEVVNRPGWAPNNMLTIMLFPDAYLAAPGGSTTAVQENEVEAGPGADSATLTVDFTPPAPGEGEGEGEGEPQGNEILSNIYPPFIDVGSTVVLTAPPGSGWQWSKDGAPITGATDRELIFNPVKDIDAGSYTVDYNDGTTNQTTPAFVMTVSPEGSVPVGGGIALATLLAACALGGASAVKRRR